MYIRLSESRMPRIGINAWPQMASGISVGQMNAGKIGAGSQLRHFECSEDGWKKIEQILGRPVSKEELRMSVNAAIEKAASLTSKAAIALQKFPRSSGTRILFHEIFGTSPEFVPTWRPNAASWKDRGELVALRLKRAANLLASDQIQYYCWGCPGGDRDPKTYDACNYPPGKQIIGLGKGFWENLKNKTHAYEFMAMTLLHEALHISYISTITGKHEGRYGNAYCYQRFVPEMNQLYLYPETEKACPSLLRLGSRGPEVRKLQELLNRWIRKSPNPNIPSELTVNGMFDRRTQAALRAFQRAAKLREKGVAGSETWQHLLRQK